MKQILNDILASSQFEEGVAWKRVYYNAGDKIIEKDEIGNSIFLVEDGCVRVFGIADLEKDVKVSPSLCDLEKGSIFGDVCLYSSHRRTATVRALTNANILEIRSDLLSAYLDGHPEVGYLFLKELFEIMAARLETAGDRIEKLLAWGIKAHDIDKYL